jgi:hypothetical protein
MVCYVFSRIEHYQKTGGECIKHPILNLSFYQARVGIFDTVGRTVIMENFGVDKRLAPWFALGLEINNQQWIYKEGNGAGLGIYTYYRWHLFGKRKLSPYLAYGAGIFYFFLQLPSQRD